MAIDALIAHRIRCSPENGTTLQLATDELPVDDGAGELVYALKSRFFSRLTREHGSFAEDGDPPSLAQHLKKLDPPTHNLVELTTSLMTEWKALLDTAPQPLDAHVICFTESGAGGARVFYLMVAGHKSAHTIATDLTVSSTGYLDLGPGLFGIKVDLHEWQTAKHYAYLSFVPPRGNRVLADTFIGLTGFTPGMDKSESTATFLEGVEAFTQHVPPDQVDDYRNQVVDYCAHQEQRDEPVDLTDLTRAVEGIDGERFNRFMSDYTPAADSALMMDRRSLRRYVKFAGRERDLAISFSSSQLNSRVHYNPDKDTLSIEGIPRGLRDQLLRHLNTR